VNGGFFLLGKEIFRGMKKAAQADGLLQKLIREKLFGNRT